jgi:alkanesulfonate monooxygenase SsuD/methylene tetrahydromethanopterin reductase-like flavin-dependent oxidoreductase (luciferase family)
MKFGIFYEHQLPRPWHDRSEQQLIADALQQIELADKLGFHAVWEVEHHFLEEYSHSSAPEVFLAAAAARTKNIRIGHGVVLTAPGFNHPVRTAERIAMLDLVSQGRVEFGSGESSSEAELGGFHVDPATKREQWEEGLRVAVRAMTETPFTGVDGKYVHIPPRNVVPKPVQQPHPPLWVACSRRETILLAARHGIGALTFAFVDPEEAAEYVRAYEETLATECVPLGKSVNAQIACVTPMMCHPDERTAIDRGLEGANFFGYSLAHYYAFGRHEPAKTDVWAEFVEKRASKGFSPEAAAAQRQELNAKVDSEGSAGLRGAVGTPEQIRAYLRRYEDAGVDQVIFVLQAGKNEHDHICESLELFGREVLPEFAERDAVKTRGKRLRLAPLVEIAMSKRVDDAPPLPDGYAYEALLRQLVVTTAPDKVELLDKVAEESAVGDNTTMASITGDRKGMMSTRR